MVAYADTGFIVSLYLQESTSLRAIEIARRITGPLPITQFLLLELRNAFHLRINRGEIEPGEMTAAWRTFEMDCREKVFFHASTPFTDTLRLARELSDHLTPRSGIRSLDLLHLASARILGASELLTFDQKQAKAARAEGFKVRP